MGRAARRFEDEFEETLSLIDMPITPMKQQQHQQKPSSDRLLKQSGFVDVENRACLSADGDEPDFNFGSLSGSPSTRVEMSSADELFRHGQILPLRLSVDSRLDRVSKRVARPDSASSSIEFTSVSSSSRSSSYSSTSSLNIIINNSNATKTAPYHAPRIRNQFHAHPSPTPRIRVTAPSKSSTRCRKSSVWDIFRLGPVQPPGIELNNLKARNPSSNRTQPTRGFIAGPERDSLGNRASLKQGMFGLGGCRCAADAVEDVQRPRIVVIRSGTEGRRRSGFKEGEVKEELKRIIEEARRMRSSRQGTEAEVLPRRRTFEWLKQLNVEGGEVN
uniref:Uncharacterized protein n=1 Tax=Kalanchoe fedtschenkoi TaxID=63787 RepID=A0A7N0T5L2_KALFE